MENILIVNDSLPQAEELKSMLDGEYRVTIARTAEDGLRRVNGEAFSLILLDAAAPGIDGFTLLKRLQEKVVAKSVPVILITSQADAEHERHGLTLGAADYITKPFNPPLVRARVNTHVRLYHYRRQAEQHSMTDQLTGIANRSRYDRYSMMKWREAVRRQMPFSICMFDLDHFKAYNDRYGHPAGDQVLAAVAKAVSSRLKRGTDFFARYRGEKFVAISMDDPARSIFEHAKNIRQAVEDLHIPHNPAISRWVTVSAGGITVVPPAEGDYAFFQQLADTMLYDAKRHGRNRVVWADERLRQLFEK